MERRWKKMNAPYERYSISNYGDIMDDKNGKLKRLYPTGGNEMKRYYKTGLHNTNEGKRDILYIHRLVAEYWLDPVPGCNVVHHIDANSYNNRADNLEWTTQSENTEARRRGFKQNEKIEPMLGLKIRKLLLRGAAIARVAQAFNTRYLTVYHIKKGVHVYLQVYDMIEDRLDLSAESFAPYIADQEVFDTSILRYCD
jgi:hypothetical protein